MQFKLTTSTIVNFADGNEVVLVDFYQFTVQAINQNLVTERSVPNCLKFSNAGTSIPGKPLTAHYLYPQLISSRF